MDPVSLDSIIISENTDGSFDFNLVDPPDDFKTEEIPAEHQDCSNLQEIPVEHQDTSVSNEILSEFQDTATISTTSNDAIGTHNNFEQNSNSILQIDSGNKNHNSDIDNNSDNITKGLDLFQGLSDENTSYGQNLTKKNGSIDLENKDIEILFDNNTMNNEPPDLFGLHDRRSPVLTTNNANVDFQRNGAATEDDISGINQHISQELMHSITGIGQQIDSVEIPVQRNEKETSPIVDNNDSQKKQVIPVDTSVIQGSDDDLAFPDMAIQRVRKDSSSGSEFDFELPPVKKKIEDSGANTENSSSKPSALTSMPLVNVTVQEMTVVTDTSAVKTSTVMSTEVVASSVSTATKKIIKYEESIEINNDFQTNSQKKAADDWANVQTIEAGFMKEGEKTKSAIPDSSPMLSYYEMQEELMRADFSSVKDTIHTAVDRHGFSALKHFLFGPPKMHRSLLPNREKVFCIAASSFNNSNGVHIRALQTIYKCLTGSRFDCSRFGGHWEEIGFQGKDPSTDLRGTGLLGLLNLIYLLRDPKYSAIAKDIYKLSLHPTQNFPFCLMGINMSRITLQSLREDCLNKECNKREDVLSVVNDFYTAIYLKMYQIWKSQQKTISDSGYVIKEIETEAKKNPHHVLKNLEEYLKNKKSAMNLDNMEPGGDNFLSVCETEAGQY